jgi:hydroxymethylglutaryl-CoA reductase (NADPH)
VLVGAEEITAARAAAPFPRDARVAIPKRGIYSEAARRDRLAFVREQTGRDLACLGQVALSPETLTGNIENLIGAVEVPIGLAGPLWFRGDKVSGRVYAPMATTEGALVASATRGAIALSRSGGVTTQVLCQQMTRVPLFVLSDLHSAVRFADFVRSRVPEIREHALRVSRHAQLISIEPALMGHMVNVRFVFDTADAAGQNMTTSCTWHACQWLLQQIELEALPLEGFLIEGAMSGDKKVTFESFLSGRGTRVTAECVLDPSVLSHVLRVTADELLKTHERALAGSVQSGMVGYNINVANVVAAIFTATGQDIACVHESSLAQLHLEKAACGVYASVLLPSLIVGTIGGGTHLPRQNECLQIIDCEGPGKSARLAEIIAGYCLATDLSTMSAVAGGQFAAAHDRLGRNRRIRWLERQDLSKAFFEPGLRRTFADDTITVLELTPIAAATTGSSIVTDLTARTVRKLIGLFPFRLTYRSGRDPTARRIEVMVKVKPLDEEVILAANSLAAMAGGRLRDSYARFKDRTGFAGCHVRELGVYAQADPRFWRRVPKVYDTFRDDRREAYVVVMERLTGMTLMETADDVSGWSRRHVETALRDIAEVHAVWYRREEELERVPWLGPFPTAKSMTETIELWEQLGVHAFEEFPEWVSSEDRRLHHDLVESIPDWWSEIEAMPRTLVHNDFNPRNIAFRSRNGDLELCAYDWELATLHLPQHDLAELLCFVLTPAATRAEVGHYVEVHRRALEEASGYVVDPALWRSGFALCLADLAVNRIALYLMAHTLRHYGFIERVVGTLRRLIALELGR